MNNKHHLACPDSTAASPATFRQAVPQFSLVGKRLLDVGCGNGATLMHPHYAAAAERCGVDVDVQAIREGGREYPELSLRVAKAEELPYPDDRFDAMISKVTLPYTDIPKALAEMHRALKAGGDLYLTMHDFKMASSWFAETVKAKGWKRALDHGYIFLASAVYLASGRVPARPWNGTRETFQTVRSLRRDLTRAGFTDLVFERTLRDFIVRARKFP